MTCNAIHFPEMPENGFIWPAFAHLRYLNTSYKYCVAVYCVAKRTKSPSLRDKALLLPQLNWTKKKDEKMDKRFNNRYGATRYSKIHIDRTIVNGKYISVSTGWNGFENMFSMESNENNKSTFHQLTCLTAINYIRCARKLYADLPDKYILRVYQLNSLLVCHLSLCLSYAFHPYNDKCMAPNIDCVQSMFKGVKSISGFLGTVDVRCWRRLFCCWWFRS